MLAAAFVGGVFVPCPAASLQIHLYQGRNLPAADDNGSLDPYIKLIIGAVSVTSTKKLSNTCPMWCVRRATAVGEGGGARPLWLALFRAALTQGSCLARPPLIRLPRPTLALLLRTRARAYALLARESCRAGVFAVNCAPTLPRAQP